MLLNIIQVLNYINNIKAPIINTTHQNTVSENFSNNPKYKYAMKKAIIDAIKRLNTDVPKNNVPKSNSKINADVVNKIGTLSLIPMLNRKSPNC